MLYTLLAAGSANQEATFALAYTMHAYASIQWDSLINLYVMQDSTSFNIRKNWNSDAKSCIYR